MFMKPLLVVGAVLALSACGVHRPSEPISESRTVDAGGAESARVEVELGAGELRIEPGSEHLLAGEFRVDPALKPEIKYDVAAQRGYLSVRQPSIANSSFGGFSESRWELRLSDRLPTELNVKLGAGKGVLKLAGLALRRLRVEVGVGEVELDLNGRWEQDLEGEVHGGVGEARVHLPRDVGVRVRATGGIGDIKAENLRRQGNYWVNDQYGRSPIDVRLDVQGGIGSIRLIG